MKTNLLLLPGLGDSGPTHWQSLWQTSSPAFSRIVQKDWDRPVCSEWKTRLEGAVADLGPDTVLVAHSLSCLLVAHWSAATRLKVRGALLVAPPDPGLQTFPTEISGFSEVPLVPLAMPSILVASENDPYARLAFAQACALAWGSELVSIGDAGHVNSTSGYGPWQQGEALLKRLVERTA